MLYWGWFVPSREAGRVFLQPQELEINPSITRLPYLGIFMSNAEIPTQGDTHDKRSPSAPPNILTMPASTLSFSLCVVAFLFPSGPFHILLCRFWLSLQPPDCRLKGSPKSATDSTITLHSPTWDYDVCSSPLHYGQQSAIRSRRFRSLSTLRYLQLQGYHNHSPTPSRARPSTRRFP